jgi:hypothetical protein
MATTSKGLRYPVGTDPVAIHTDLQNLATDVDGDLNVSVATTKGDLIAHNGTQEVRLPVGANGTFLRANSSASTGVEWGTGWTTDASINGLIANYRTLANTDTSIFFSSIPQTYDHLDIAARILFRSASINTRTTLVNIQINGTEITFNSDINTSSTPVSSAGIPYAPVINSTLDTVGAFIHMRIPFYSKTDRRKLIEVHCFSSSGTSGNTDVSMSIGEYTSNDAISQIQFMESGSVGSPLPINVGSNVNLYGRVGL